MERQRTCEGCRWFVRSDGKNSGECRRYPLPHGKNTGWPRTAVWEGCGEWTDASITPQEAERRDLVRQFALAIVQGMYANPEDTSVQVAKQAQLFAREFQETIQEGQQ